MDVIRWGYYKGSAEETGGVGKVKDGGDAKEATGNVNATSYRVDYYLEVEMRLKESQDKRRIYLSIGSLIKSVPIRSTHLQEKELKKQRALLQKEQVCAVAAC